MKVTMQEPVAWLVTWENEGKTWTQAHASEVPARGQGLRQNGCVADLITTDQAEAYAAAKVREALEEAASIAGEKSAVLPHYSDITRGYADGRAAAATAIRALIPQQ